VPIRSIKRPARFRLVAVAPQEFDTRPDPKSGLDLSAGLALSLGLWFIICVAVTGSR
jgi:hypothetical protein